MALTLKYINKYMFKNLSATKHNIDTQVQHASDLGLGALGSGDSQSEGVVSLPLDTCLGHQSHHSPGPSVHDNLSGSKGSCFLAPLWRLLPFSSKHSLPTPSLAPWPTPRDSTHLLPSAGEADM